MINKYQLSRGSIISLRGDSEQETKWIVVSSSLWLNLLSIASKHSAGIAGLIRDVIHVIPVIDSPPPEENLLVVDILMEQPGLSNHSHALFYCLRTKSLERLVAIHGNIEQPYLDDIDAGIELFFDLSIRR